MKKVKVKEASFVLLVPVTVANCRVSVPPGTDVLGVATRPRRAGAPWSNVESTLTNWMLAGRTSVSSSRFRRDAVRPGRP